MNVTTRIKMNLRQPDITLGIDAVQGDCCSRSLEIILYSGIAPWMIPDGITVAVRYSKPDGTKGYYDTLPNGSTAWRIHDNLLTVALAPQMLTVAGTVLTQIEMIQGVKILSTFGLKIRVEANPAAGCMRSEDYVSWLQWIKDESEEHVRLIRQSQLAASQAAESAVAATESANAFASHAEDAAADAKSAAASAASSRAEAAAIAAGVSAIVAGNESYTKMESSLLYSPAITQPMTGENISISDSAEASFRGMTLLGKTTQNSTPTPEKPIPLINAGAEGSIDIRVSGKNLLHYPYNHTTKTQNGVTFTDNGDGSITIKGTASTDTWFHLMRFNLGKEWWSSKYKMSPYIFSGVPDTIRLEYSPMQKLTMITIPKGISIDTTVYPQVEINTAATVWEPLNSYNPSLQKHPMV